MKTFEQYLNESVSIAGIEATNIQAVIKIGLETVAQFHIYHWLTKSYAQHNALSAFYSGLEDAIDALAENYVAVGGLLDGEAVLYTRMKFNIGDVVNDLQRFRAVLSDSLAMTGSPEMLSLNDCVIDIQRLVDKTIYQLDLS